MILQQAKPSDIAAVLNRVSSVTRAEFERTGITPWQALKALNGLRKTAGMEVAYEGDTPLFLLAAVKHPMARNLRVLTFVATEAVFDHPTKGRLRFVKQTFRRLAKRWPKATFESNCFVNTPEARRWFAWLGFKEAARNPSFTVFHCA